jgi:hypothetical protein
VPLPRNGSSIVARGLLLLRIAFRWEGQFSRCLDSDTARAFHDETLLKEAQTLHVTDAVLPGFVARPGKWWSTAGGERAAANPLLPSSWSPWGQPAYNDTVVAVSAR